MKDTNIFITKTDGAQRQIDWPELNQLKKDILWVFDENGGELQNSFIPEDSFALPYWEYVTLSGNHFSYDDDRNFYKEGALIIVLCMITEYIDIEAGSQLVFGNNNIEEVLKGVQQFEPVNGSQYSLKELVLTGLSIVASLTKEAINNKQIVEHPDLNGFYAKLSWVDQTFIQPYYKSKCV